MSPELLQVENLTVRYPLPRSRWFGPRAEFAALTDVSLAVREGGSLGVVGESGSGKSTLARAILGLARPCAGRILWRGEAVETTDRRRMRPLRRHLQVVFQDPFGSLDPRMTAGHSIAEAIVALEGPARAADRTARVAAALQEVGLDASLARRYPHELSGGQCQRVAIARATVVRPQLLICDEAVSALDVSVQAQIVNLLRETCRRHGMALLFISHNLAVVRYLCEEVAVLCRGRLVEHAPREQLFAAPRDPYTQALLAAVPALPPMRPSPSRPG